MKTLFCGLMALIVVFAGPSVRSVGAETVDVFGQPYPSLGVKISRGAIVHLADLVDESGRLLPRPHYLPAGTLLNLVDRSVRRRGRTWNMAITDSGLLIYVLGNVGPHYYNAEPLLARGEGQIAIAHSQFTVTSETYGPVSIGPSEHYRFAPADPGFINLIIDEEKMGNRYTTDDTIRVDERFFAIITTEDINDMRAVGAPHFIEYGIQSELETIFAGLTDLDLDPQDRRQIQNFLSRRFINEKSCRDTIAFEHSLEGAAGAELDRLLSVVSASLEITGSASFSTSLEEGVEFEVQRYARGGDVVEINREVIREECSDLDFDTRILISDVTGRVAEINTLVAEQDLRLETAANGLPIYRCRNEYLALRRVLVETYDLSEDAAALGLAHGARYTGPTSNASNCPSS